MPRFLSSEWIEALDASLASSVFASGVRLVIQHLVDDDIAYYVAVDDERARVRAGRAEDPTVTFTQDDTTAAAIAQGRLSAQQAFMSGRLVVRGDLPALNGARDVMDELDRAFRSVRQQTEF
ncbi:MAG: SCP2 sterol-binding domain-containing protein [Acidimicrobiales bacterium]